jgi:hypothetical protein
MGPGRCTAFTDFIVGCARPNSGWSTPARRGPGPGEAGTPTRADPSGRCYVALNLRRLLVARGVESTIGLLKHYHAADSAAPKFHVSFGQGLLDELLEMHWVQS